jgi:hypothetical protein
VLVAGGLLLIIAIGGLISVVIDVYHDTVAARGLSPDPTPVSLTIGADALTVPGNMMRSGRNRAGGVQNSIDLVLLWPRLTGYTLQDAPVFEDGGPLAPLIYATIAPRSGPLDSTGRLDEVYSRFFVDKPLPGPDGLVGRRLSGDSGYGGEVLYFSPAEANPFVARCPEQATADVPATCLRDVNIGKGLSILYRFNRDLLKNWRAMDAGVLKLAASFLSP